MNVIRLAQWMNEQGHTSIIIGRDDTPLIQLAKEKGIPAETINPSLKYFDVLTALRLAKILMRYHSDVLCIHPASDINLCVIAKIFSTENIKLMYVQHMQVGVNKKDWFHSWEYKHLDAWITPLPSMWENVLRFTRMNPSRVYIIPFGIDLRIFSPNRISKLHARDQYGIPRDVFVAGVVGRLDYGKGQEYLIRAIGLLKKKNIFVHALIVGDETRGESQMYGEKLRTLINEFGLQEQIQIHPFSSDIAYAYAAMDVFCLTSISETYGMVTLEAMAMQLPIIATNSAGTPDIIQDDVNGLLVPPQNVEALADAILRLYSDHDLSMKIAMQARKDVEEKFTHLKQCELLEECIEKIM